MVGVISVEQIMWQMQGHISEKEDIRERTVSQSLPIKNFL